MLNIVIPMAGAGTRFRAAGYSLPKPIIPIFGKPMISIVVKNLLPKIEHRFIFLVQTEHYEKYQEIRDLVNIDANSVIIKIDGLTNGAAMTVLQAEKLINDENPLMIANSDQFIDFSIDEYLDEIVECDGAIMTMKASESKWSYVKLNNSGFIIEVKEKEVISNLATVGVYNFSKGSDFVSAAKKMIFNGDRVKNEFYVAPVYNYLIKDNAIIKNICIGESKGTMYGLGTPEDLNYFLKNHKFV